MRKKEWLLLALAVLIVAGAASGLYTYRSAKGPKVQSTASSTSAIQAENSQASDLPEGTPFVNLWVTRDFGETVLFKQKVALHDKDTVMDLLKKNLSNVETAYNGGFVQAINGLSSQYRVGDTSSKKLDWFYSVNGLMADVGAGEYPIRSGDSIWWDYHDWSYAMRVPAQIAAFPHPFVSRVTGEPLRDQLMVAGDNEQVAQQLSEGLHQLISKMPGTQVKQTKAIPVSKWNEHVFEQEQGLILIGDRKSLLQSPFVQQMMKEREALGLFATITDQGIQTYDTAGNPSKLLSGEGDALVFATKNLGTDMPILMVTGNSDSALTNAVEKLIQPDKDYPFQLMYASVLSDDQVTRLPFNSNKDATP